MNWASRTSKWHAPSWTGFRSWQALYAFLHTVKETPGQRKAQRWGRDGRRAPIYLSPKIPQYLSHCTIPPGQFLQEVMMLLTLPHQHSLTAYRTATQVPWGSLISLAPTNTEGWGWDAGIKGCNIPPFSILLYLKSLRSIQPFPNSHWKPKLSQVFIGKWGSLGPALLGTGFFESGKTGEVRDKSLSSTAGSHIWAAFVVD